MNIRIRKGKRPKRRKKPARKTFKAVAPRRRPARSQDQGQDERQKLVVMTEFTNHSDDSSTIYVCTTPQAALKKAITAIVTTEAMTRLRGLTPLEANLFLQAVKDGEYEVALGIWNTAQERKGQFEDVWFSCEIWSASIHEDVASSKVYMEAEKAWQLRVATQSEATA